MSIIQQIMNLPLFVKIAIVIAVYFMFFRKENFGNSPFAEIYMNSVGVKPKPRNRGIQKRSGLKPRPHNRGIRNRSILKDSFMKPSKRVRIKPFRFNSIRKMKEKKKKVMNKKKELQKALREQEQENEDFPINFEKEIRMMKRKFRR